MLRSYQSALNTRVIVSLGAHTLLCFSARMFGNVSCGRSAILYQVLKRVTLSVSAKVAMIAIQAIAKLMIWSVDSGVLIGQF